MLRPLPAVFFRTETGREPVRQWLKELPRNERKIIGEDIMTVQFRWPLGMPLVDHVGAGIWEVRSKLPTRIARTLFLCMKAKSSCCMDSLRRQGKHQRKTELWLCSAKMPTSKASISKNTPRGSNFVNFLRHYPVLAAMHVAALTCARAPR